MNTDTAKDKKSLQTTEQWKWGSCIIFILCSWRGFGRTTTFFGRFSAVPDSFCLCRMMLAGIQRRSFSMTVEVFPDWQASTSSLWRSWGIVFDRDVIRLGNLWADGFSLMVRLTPDTTTRLKAWQKQFVLSLWSQNLAEMQQLLISAEVVRW